MADLSDESFAALMSRVQAGDPAAAAELVRQYEAEIRLEERVRLRVQDGRVRRMFDSMDISQSVLGDFFAGVATGRFAPENPRHLFGLLMSIIRNKLLTHVRDLRRQKRDLRRDRPLDAAQAMHAPGETPSQLVSHREILGAFRERLTDEERQLSDRRGCGEPWTAIACELGGTADGRRKQLERAFERIALELGLTFVAPPIAG